MRRFWGVVICTLLASSALAGPKEPSAPCGNGAQCLDLADAARNGKGREPDHALALRAYEKACEVSEARGCIEAARLYQKGWMFEVDRNPIKARELAGKAIQKSASCAGSDNCVIGFDGNYMMLELNAWPDYMKSQGTKLYNDADKLCQTSGEACHWFRDHAFAFSDHSYVDRTQVIAARDRAATNLESQCKKSSNANSCYWAGKYAKGQDAAMKMYEPACKAGNREACWEYYDLKIDSVSKADRPATLKEAMATFEPYCSGKDPIPECRELGQIFLIGLKDDGFDLPKDIAKGTKYIENTCNAGDVRACEALGKSLHDGKLLGKNDTKAQELLGRGCRLSEPDDYCAMCEYNNFPKSIDCQKRNAWQAASTCENGDENACANVGDLFRGKTGPFTDHGRAAKYYRRACDAAVKTACSTLDEMCQTETDIDAAMCQQSLIHTDLFYEAEWQYRQTGKADLGGGGTLDSSKTNDKVSGLDQGESASGGAGVSLKRGSLDADLVVGIVLDRARQAAIQVVVDELQHVGGGRVAGYLRDLLTQAALMLGDRNTLRREKLTDLARTVVRALLASNLVNTLYPDEEALASKELYAQWGGASWTENWRKANKERLRRYMTDWTYYLLGQTKLFVAPSDAMPPLCPFGDDQGKKICDWLGDLKSKKPKHDHLSALLHLDSFVDGLALARVIRMEHDMDLRRFIEALGRSKTIANFSSTPGLNLYVWQKDLVDGIEGRLKDLRDETDAIAKLGDPASFSTTPTWTDLLNWGRTTRKLLSDRGAAALFSHEQQEKLSELSRTITQAALPVYSAGVASAQATESDEAKAARISADIIAKLNTWDTTMRSDLTVRVMDLRRRMTLVRPMLTSLARQIDEIRAAVRRLVRGNTLAIDEIPLSGLPDLNESLDAALDQLKKLDEQLRAVFPGARRTQVRFAISAVVRLRGFLSLMDRISRRLPLNQTVGEMMASLKMLGNVRKGRFSAPLFDIVEPVIEKLETHRPLDADVLFSVIARARLDSLVTSLGADSKRKPCENDSGTECWTVKVIHALQESVQRDGESVKVDGGLFAKRLAIHGDDFKKRHKWSSFFHLTVGFGGMYSSKPPEMDSMGNIVDGKNRTVPLVAEQIGFGKASPTFWRDTLTFKFGVFGSGILYRMVLDSAESNAVSLGGFMAFDINDYVELFVAPAIMLYPPEGDRSLTPRLGVSAGISVPLGAYLEKLTD